MKSSVQPGATRRSLLGAGLVCTVSPLWVMTGTASANPSVIARQVRWSFELFNPLAQELRDQEMWFYAPAAHTPRQKLDSLRVSVPSTHSADELGQSIVHLKFNEFAPLARRVVGVTANLSMQTQTQASVLTDGPLWLKAERFVEVDDPAIQTAAAVLRRPEPRDTARAIYDWVRQNLQYAGYVADDLGALSALTKRRGDCTEYAYLTVALARANGVPARVVGGHDVDRDSVLRAEAYHNWAELYFDGRWQVVDAQKELWLEPAERYVSFRLHSERVQGPVASAHRYAIRGRLQARF